MILDIVRFIFGNLFLFGGIIIFAIEVFGTYRFEYVLNRMHAAAVGDTSGIGITLIGLMILSGWNFTTLKMMVVIVFIWCASPVSSHLISRLEAITGEEMQEHCETTKEVREHLGIEDAEE